MNNHHNEAVERKNFIWRKIKALAVTCLFLGFCAGFFVGVNCQRIKKNHKGSEAVRLKGYKFISPLLDYEMKSELDSKEFYILKYDIEKYIKDKIKDNKAIYVSVYFRDMLNGPWFGINENDNFSPASLLKVPVMIAYLKSAELNPDILKYQIAYDKEIIEDKTVRQNIVPDSKLELDKSYSIEELIRRMIVYSDNASKGLLLNNISEDVLNKVYTDLGIIIPDIRGKEDFLTTKEYSSFFRVLFNASYLNKDMSEKALGILSQTAFKMGIVRGVPSNIVVAHKFAERGNLSNQTVQLHDCGIVYYKEKPYLLCVMTYDRDFQELEAVIKEISEIAYKKIDSSYKKYK